MKFFKEVIANILKQSDESFSGHTSFRVADDTAIGENPVREITLDAVPLDETTSMITLSWEGGEKVFEKKTTSEEAKHLFQLISVDLSNAVDLTSQEKFDAAKDVMKKLEQTYANTTDTPVETNLPKFNTTQSNQDDHLLRTAKVTMQNLFFSSADELLDYQKKMKELQPSKNDQDAIPLWDKVNKESPESKDELALPSMSYEDVEKQKGKETKNLDKRIKEQVKTELESALEEKKATMFTDSDKTLADAMRGVGRNWDEIKKYMVKELNYDKESVDLYIDDLRNKEEGIKTVEENVNPLTPPADLVSPETHEKLLKDIEDKKEEKLPVEKEIEEKVEEEPIIEESAKSSVCSECDGEGSVPVVRGGRVIAVDCPSCGGDKHVKHMDKSVESSEEIARADNDDIRKVAADVANPLQEPIQEEPSAEMTQDVVPMEKPMEHDKPQKGDRVTVSSDLADEKPGFDGTFVSDYQSEGTDFSIVETDDGDLLDVESHRVVKTSNGAVAQTSDASSEPMVEKTPEESVKITPSSEKLTMASSLEDIEKEAQAILKLIKEADIQVVCKGCGDTFTEETEPGVLPYCPQCSAILNKKSDALDNPPTTYCPNCKKDEPFDSEWKGEKLFQTCKSCGKETGTIHAAKEYKPCPYCNALGSNPYVCLSCLKLLKKADKADFSKCSDNSGTSHAGPLVKIFIGKEKPVIYCDKHVPAEKKANLNKQANNADISKIANELGIELAFEKAVNMLDKKLMKNELTQKEYDDQYEKLKLKHKVSSLNKKADPTPLDAPRPTDLKDVKITPKYVDKDKAVPATPEIDAVLSKMDELEQKLSVLDQAKQQIQARMKEEMAKIDQTGERVQLEAQLQEAVEKAGVLIEAVESRVVSWRDKLLTLENKDVQLVPKLTPNQMLEKIYNKFEGAEKYVQSVLNGMLSLAKNVTERTLVRWPNKRSELNKEASPLDTMNTINEELLAALEELSSPL